MNFLFGLERGAEVCFAICRRSGGDSAGGQNGCGRKLFGGSSLISEFVGSKECRETFSWLFTRTPAVVVSSLSSLAVAAATDDGAVMRVFVKKLRPFYESL